MHRQIRMPEPYPDENCYSILCRYAVRAGSLSGARICQVLFGNIVRLTGLLYKPFRTRDVIRWGEEAGSIPLYGKNHSCLQYFSAFMDFEDAILLQDCRKGFSLTSGQTKRISHRCGITRIQKEHLWYCPRCVTDDIREYGETCWRRLPQMPGVSYCTQHRVRLRESSIAVSDISFQLFPASYVVNHVRDTERDTSGNVFEEEFLQIARDTQWLLENGFGLADYGSAKIGYRRKTGKELTGNLLYTGKDAEQAGFEQYLAGRVLRDSGRMSLDRYIQKYLSTILTLEKDFGSVAKFYDP